MLKKLGSWDMNREGNREGQRNPNTEEAALEEPERPVWRGSILRIEDEEKEKPMEIRMVRPSQEAGITCAKAQE